MQVKPNAKQQKLVRREDGTWLVHLQAPPTDGKANQELVTCLAQHFGITKAQVSIRSGHTGRIKRVWINADSVTVDD
ncbi:hypothetical protein GFS31_25380 [Leptolyngbya sp. BL0902]|nr:hypothetical protein GFS31_25380 [Leptolyngbya sp. BL0902]